MRKTLLILFVALFSIVVSGCSQDAKPLACTEEAKICADGTVVGRTGENCQFAPCPKEDLITISSPSPWQSLTSPINIAGQARGSWYFEGSFPVKVFDDRGQEIAHGVAEAQGDWMSENFVPFEAILEFDNPQTSAGTIVFYRNNPSGLPENDDQLVMPVVFSQDEKTPTRTVKLYYYNPSLDQDETGNIMCSRQGLVAVEREIALTQTPIQDTIKQLISGDISAVESDVGLESEFPLPGFVLLGASLTDSGILTLEFSDPQNQTIGGACRVGVLWNQIEATAKQFSEVKEVRFLPEELFQP